MTSYKGLWMKIYQNHRKKNNLISPFSMVPLKHKKLPKIVGNVYSFKCLIRQGKSTPVENKFFSLKLKIEVWCWNYEGCLLFWFYVHGSRKTLFSDFDEVDIDMVSFDPCWIILRSMKVIDFRSNIFALIC